MFPIVTALIGSAATGAIGLVAMKLKNRRQDKGDRIGDLSRIVSENHQSLQSLMIANFAAVNASLTDLTTKIDTTKDDLSTKIEANKDAIHALDIKVSKEIHALEVKFGEKLNAVDMHLTGKIGNLEARFPVELQPKPSA